MAGLVQMYLIVWK